MEYIHKPVLLDEVISYLNIKPDAIYVDCTTGEGGHSYYIANRLSKEGTLVMIDLDKEILEKAKERLKNIDINKVFANDNFSNIKEILNQNKIEYVNGILMDLGFSSYHIEERDTGLSFLKNQKLDMRLDKKFSLSAWDIINKFKEEDIANIIFEYGEEKFSRRIAKKIIKKRAQKSIDTTFELRSVVEEVYPKRYYRINPATKTFQALRIYVNKELENLKKGLNDATSCLKVNGRFCVISYHSLEDRIAKNFFNSLKNAGTFQLINKKVIIPTKEEIGNNKRARSAKMRVIERI